MSVNVRRLHGVVLLSAPLALALSLVGCEESVSPARRAALEGGLCEEGSRRLSDIEFLSIVLRHPAVEEAWKGRNSSPQAFVAAHPKCCFVGRYSRQDGWPIEVEYDADGRILSGMRAMGPSRYLVMVQVNYADTSGDGAFSRHFLSACGEVLFYVSGRRSVDSN